MSTSVITLDDMVATLTFIGTPSSHPECGLHNIQPTRASLNTLHSYRTMYFLVIDDRACQIFDRSKYYDQTVCRGGALVGLPIADKADYFRSSCKL